VTDIRTLCTLELVAFLNEYPDRTAAIQGYTDSVGTQDYNQSLSARRADSVKSYLAGQGIGLNAALRIG
jgi:outer membrane protein OmpA-like peptidoglycan-associated protein